jgi:hypothetical protein
MELLVDRPQEGRSPSVESQQKAASAIVGTVSEVISMPEYLGRSLAWETP